MPQLNPTLAGMAAYASKAISQAARLDPAVLNLSIGEPVFGPPTHLLPAIAEQDLNLQTFLSSVKSYEHTQGSLRLRRAIADWYARRHQLEIDPEREILITHGGVEALTLALLCCTAPGDAVALTNPSYLLYERAIQTLGRRALGFARTVASQEYQALAENDASFTQGMGGARALIINSPENPTGYVLSENEWCLQTEMAIRHDNWLIHDEVYDAMAFMRPHFPARAFDPRGTHSILLNSCSKKFGVPGLRIGWMVANPSLIELAGKAHDYLLLGVNRQYEAIAARMLEDPTLDNWLDDKREMLFLRGQKAMKTLTPARGFDWPRQPMGGMFLFPSVSRLYTHLPLALRQAHPTVGEAVAHYLFHGLGVATVPGMVYGRQGDQHLRMVLCAEEMVFNTALTRLAGALEGLS